MIIPELSSTCKGYYAGVINPCTPLSVVACFARLLSSDG